ncbi:hypothetical protein RQP46_009958 [Phenoliferia psychrophenolica]
MKTIVTRLSPIDALGYERVKLTIGSLLTTPVDPGSIEAALSRVSEKWRLLAGRLQRDKNTGEWVVRVPVDDVLPADYARDYFKSPGAPETSVEYEKQDAPLISVHVSTFSNYQCVGLTMPHGVFDGIGLGLVVKALDAELTGKDWAPPPVLELPPHVGDANLRRLSNGSARSSWDLGLLVWRILVEKFWYRASSKQLFLGRDVVVRLVERVKEEVKAKTGGAEWVSTGDVLFAFAEKAFYSSETTNDTLLVTSSVWDIRTLLSTKTIDLAKYPHNAMSFYIADPVKISSLSTTPLWTLALRTRRALNAARTLPAFADTLDWMSTALPIPSIARGVERFQFTNHVSANFTGTTWGAPSDALAGWWIWLFMCRVKSFHKGGSSTIPR